MVIKKEGDVDIGCGNAFGGAGEDEGTGGAPVEKVCDIVDAFHYEETSMDLAGFNAYFKAYMKKVLGYLSEKNPDRVAGFKTGAAAFFKWAKENFEELSFHTGQSFDVENLIVMSYYKNEEDEAPTFIYMMDGLKFIKV